MRGKNFWNSLLPSNMMSDARKKAVMEYLCAQEVDFTNLFPDDLGLKQQAERDYYLSRGFSKRQADNFVEYGDVRGTEIEYQEEKHLEKGTNVLQLKIKQQQDIGLAKNGKEISNESWKI